MENINIKFYKKNQDSLVPQYKTEGSSGADLYSAEEIDLQPGEIRAICTGIAIEIPEGYEGQIRSRSGLSLEGITVANAPGTIDSDYRGEIKVILQNKSEKAFLIKKGNRIAQIVFCTYSKASFKMDVIGQTERGEKGFGSTGL